MRETTRAERRRAPRAGRAIHAAATGAALLAALAFALSLGACGRRQPPAPVFPYAADATRVFYATNSGLSEQTFQGEAEAELPASRAPHASVLSADGRGILVAVNGWGVERIETSSDGRTYRLIDSPLPVFAGLATGGAWPLEGGFLVQLYRDPFLAPPEAGAAAAAASATPSPAAATALGAPPPAPPADDPDSPPGSDRRPSDVRLAYFPGDGGAAKLPNPFPLGLDPAFEAFALLPAGGKWFAELRKDSAARVELKFFAFGSPLSSIDPALEIRRTEFEAALRPLPLSALKGEEGVCLRAALGALGRGPWLARLRSGSGEDRWYLSSGTPEEAVNVYAWSLGATEGGASGGGAAGVLALVGDGRLASAGPSSAVLAKLPSPAEGATFTALAASGRIVAAAWEAGQFPNLSSAGILLSPLP